MSPAADDPPSFADGAASPAATGGPSSEAEPLAAGNPTAAGEAAPASGTPANRHRRRRRRHRQAPPRDGAATGAAGAEAGGETVAGGAAAARAAEAGLAATPNPARPPRRRRRRRPPFMAAGASRAGLGSALPPVAPDEGGGTDPAAAEAPEISADADPSRPRRPTLHLRRPVRGRRQLPHPPGLQVGLAGATPAAENEAQSAEEAVAGAEPAAAPGAELVARRQGPRDGDAATAGAAQFAAGAGGAGRQAAAGDKGGARTAGARPQRPGQPRRRPLRQGPGAPGGDVAARPDRPDRDARRRDRGEPRREPGRGRDARRGRDQAPRRVEQKLYALEATVDRGFEDVPDDGEEGGSRRIHWTIIKRTVADQKSGKAMSAVYVLQRDGAETEFPNLGAARAAANKTIVHPEKLTMSKAEHAAARSNSK